VTYGSFAPTEADKAAWRWYEIDRSQRIGAAIVAKYDLDPDLLRALKDAHEDDDSGVALDELLDNRRGCDSEERRRCRINS